MSHLPSAWPAACAVMCLCVTGAFAQVNEKRTPPAGYQPLASTDEAGLWRQSDEGERAVRQSPNLVKDEALNDYVRKIVCTLAGPQCGAIRVYILDVPLFNAYAMPNGAVVVWTGLLLRTENEAQLAFILGHELTHYLNRHGLLGYQSRRDTADALAFLSLGLAGVAAGTGVNLGRAYSLAELIAVGALFSYSRDQEREADGGGFDLSVALGYDPHQGARIWSYIEEEEAAKPKRRKQSLYYSDHPSNKERLATLEKRANELEAKTHAANRGEETYRAAIFPHRGEWLEEELNRGEFDETIALLDRLMKAESNSGPLQYYLGEAYRRRNAKGDLKKAVDVYRAAINEPGAPVAAYRGLGLAALKSGDKPAARDAFGEYLALAPDADDRAIVETYIASAEMQP